MTYTVSSGTLNSIVYHTIATRRAMHLQSHSETGWQSQCSQHNRAAEMAGTTKKDGALRGFFFLNYVLSGAI